MALGAADALSLLRIGLALPTAYLVWEGEWCAAAVTYAAAVASDLADGPIARRLRTVRPRGALLDHGADAFFVALTLSAVASRGLISALLPAVIVAAFGQYVWGSGAHRGEALRGNAIGRINGIAYYVLTGAFIVAEGWYPAASPALSAIALGLIGTTAFSISQRSRQAERR